MWYNAKIIFKIEINNGKKNFQFDEQFRLIKADNMEHAITKTNVIAAAEEQGFINENNNLVHWKFIGIDDISKIEAIEDGAKIYSTTHETEKEEEYLEKVESRNRIFQVPNYEFVF